jgi:hypothetical protein
MSEAIVYSSLTREEALDDSSLPTKRHVEVHRKMKPFLHLMNVRHLNHDFILCQGQLVVHEAMADTFNSIFKGLIDLKFPIQQARPMVEFGWSDPLAMAANNTSVYRPDFIGGIDGPASEHTRGTALDMETLNNAMHFADGRIEPVEFIGREPFAPAVIGDRPDVIRLFDEHNMEYGGFWNKPDHPTDFYSLETPSDEHHFELRPAAAKQLHLPPDVWAA